jgi:hypothetical protein
MLSEGQQALLLWAVALHSQGVKVRDAILTMDEPENHLHPEAMIATLRRIIDANPGGQLWVATHSVPLVAFLYQHYRDDVTLVLMEQGKAAFAGREPERVLESLMGGAENVGALREFVDLPDWLAAVRFAGECLLPPTVIAETGPEDPQVRLTESALFSDDRSDPIRVLDFGVGHGRLLDSHAAGSAGDLVGLLDYVGWDVQRSPLCEAAVRRVYGPGSSDDRLFADRNALAAKREPQSFDAVVMCNVLHEVDPGDWLGLFGKAGLIPWALKPTGELVVIEDHLMPKVESAHSHGFVVLNTAAFQALFGGAAVRVISAVGRYAGRIKTHVIPATALKKVSDETWREALGLAQAAAWDRIRVLRGNKVHSYRSGREHAYWVQEYANTTLALDHFGRAERR